MSLFMWLVVLLLAWSLLWMGAAIIALALVPRPYWRSFWVMNGLWAFIDAVIAWAGIFSPPASEADLAEILRINSCLDVVYLVAAVILMTRASERNRGFGAAILIQGLFLLIFDLVFLFLAVR